MKKRLKIYLTLFFSTLKISAFTFGGGFVIIPMLRSKFVNRLHWLEDEEMLDLTAIAQSAPGPIAVNAAVLIGYKVAGISGAAVAMLGTAMPPLIILSVISAFYTAFCNNTAVRFVLKGMQAGVAAVIMDVVITMAKNVVCTKRLLPILIMIAAFAAAYVFNCNVICIVLVCGAVGAIFMRGAER